MSYPLQSSSSSDSDDEIQACYEWWTSHRQRNISIINFLVQQEGEASSQHVQTRRNVERDRERGHNQLFRDYFADNPVYLEYKFRRRFRMRRHLFVRIVDRLTSETEYFQQRPDATGRLGLSPLQKYTAAMRILAYGISGDIFDEYLRIGESASRMCLSKFVEGVISIYGEEYLRRPNATDLQRLLFVGESRGFPGMLGSIDCMHWEWKNCPVSWKGQFARGDHGKPTIILEAVASYDLCIWHSFFGTPGTCNDINVLDRSPLFNEVFQSRAPEVNFVVNDQQYNLGYYLTDGIYPPWVTFIQSIRLPQGAKAQLFAQHQEAARKDVERAFGVLQARFAIIKNPSLYWDLNLLKKIMKACIILHNIIVEDERESYQNYYDISQFDQVDDNDGLAYSNERHPTMEAYLANRIRVRNSRMHHELKENLVEHIWKKFGHDEN